MDRVVETRKTKRESSIRGIRRGHKQACAAGACCKVASVTPRITLNMTEKLKEKITRICQERQQLGMADDVLNIGLVDDGTYNTLIQGDGLDGGPAWKPAGDIGHHRYHPGFREQEVEDGPANNCGAGYTAKWSLLALAREHRA